MPKSLAPSHHSRKDVGVPDTGEPAAAARSREIRVRLQIIEALQRLGIPHREWPDFVKTFSTNPQAQEEYCVSISPPSFQPPDFKRLNESLKEWAKAADAAWKHQRDAFMEECQSWVTLGVDEEIPAEKKTRGPGRKGRRLNATADLRADCAAHRLSGATWKEIAGDRFKVDQVKKAASKMLKLAGWPTKVKSPKTSK